MAAQALRSQPATVSAQFLDTAGAPVNPGTVTVTITRLDGTALVTDAATSGTLTAARTYVLTAAQTVTLDTLTATFTSASLPATAEAVVEIVGAYLFTETEARAFDGAKLTSTSKYTDATIEEARARITDEFAEICGIEFVPRYRLDTYSGAGRYDLMMDRFQVTSIRSLETRTSGGVVWTPYTSTELADLFIEPTGELRREMLGLFTDGRRNVRVGYEHGFSSPPLNIKRAALMALIDEIVDSNISDRAISFSGEQGTTQYWTPGLSGRGTAIHRIPEVDRILKLHMWRPPVIA